MVKPGRLGFDSRLPPFRPSDHDVCEAVRGRGLVSLSARWPADRVARAIERAENRALLDVGTDWPRLTRKGEALIDGIEPSACSGWHMGGAPAHPLRRRGGRRYG